MTGVGRTTTAATRYWQGRERAISAHRAGGLGRGEGVHRVQPDPRPAVRLTTRGRDPGDELAEREEREDSENR